MISIINNLLEVLILYIGPIFFSSYILGNKNKIRKHKIFILILLLLIPFYILNELNLHIYAIIISILSEILIYKIIFKFNIKNSIFRTFIYSVILLISNILYIIIKNYLVLIETNKILIIFQKLILKNIFMAITVTIISLLCKKLLEYFPNIRDNKKKVIYWILVLLLIIVPFMQSLSKSFCNTESYILVIMLVIMIFVISITIYQYYKNNLLGARYDKLLDFVKQYETEIDEQRTIRHETKNQLLTIKSKLIDNDKKDNIIRYIDEILKDNNIIVNHAEYAKLRYLPSNGLKGLIYFKVKEALDKNINVNINISKDIVDSCINKLSVSSFNKLGKVLGVFIDNAIEASLESQDKILGLEVYRYNKSVKFIISNSYVKVNDNLKSTKGIKRGHGLNLANKIIIASARLTKETVITDKLFIQNLIVTK